MTLYDSTRVRGAGCAELLGARRAQLNHEC